MQIYSFSPFGYEGALVTVEVDLRRGIPAIDIVGLADNAVKESRERMQAAIRNSGLDFPIERVLISLSPADLKKEGAGFDLPIALGVLAANEANKGNGADTGERDSAPVLIMGELELSGKIRAVRGVHAAAATAAAGGIFRCIVPAANAEEAREVNGMKVFGADTLEEAFAAMSSPENFTEAAAHVSGTKQIFDKNAVETNGILFPRITDGYEFGDIRGQRQLIRGLQIAAAGGHNVVAIGSPGCGKTMAMQKFPALLPLLTPEEAQPVTRIMSLAGLLHPSQPLVRTPPFRMPHQTASIEGMCGGGINCRPGEISLAHNGVLFLDEAAEFKTFLLKPGESPWHVQDVQRNFRHVFSCLWQQIRVPAEISVRTQKCACAAAGQLKCTGRNFLRRFLIESIYVFQLKTKAMEQRLLLHRNRRLQRNCCA